MLHGISAERAYGDWREMLERERGLPPGERLDLVTVATPNSTHFEIAQAFMREGFHVLCREAAHNHCRGCREAGANGPRAGPDPSGQLWIHGLPDGAAGARHGRCRRLGPRYEWLSRNSRTDRTQTPQMPATRGCAGATIPPKRGSARCSPTPGLHALHMACYVIGRRVAKVAADFASCVDGRVLEDDAMATLRFTGGEVGRLWASAVAVGQIHGLTLRVFGRAGRPAMVAGATQSARLDTLEAANADLGARGGRPCAGSEPGFADHGRTCRGHAASVREHLRGPRRGDPPARGCGRCATRSRRIPNRGGRASHTCSGACGSGIGTEGRQLDRSWDASPCDVRAGIRRAQSGTEPVDAHVRRFV